MSMWVIGAPEGGSGEEHITLQVTDLPNCAHAQSLQQVKKRIRNKEESLSPEEAGRRAERLWKFISVQDDDIIGVVNEAAVRFARAKGRVVYLESGMHALPVEWFSHSVPISALGRHKTLFQNAGAWITEITDPRVRSLISTKLQLPGTRFAKWKWVIIVVIALKLTLFVIHLVRKEMAGV